MTTGLADAGAAATASDASAGGNCCERAEQPYSSEATAENDGEVALELLDYDRMFGPTNPEYAEYREAWHRAQGDFSSPATPRSLLSPTAAVAAEDGLEPWTGLDLLKASSRPRTGCHTPAAVRTPEPRSVGRGIIHQHPGALVPDIMIMDAGALVIPPQIEAAAAKADAVAALHNASLDHNEPRGSMDWAAVSASLQQWYGASMESSST